MSSVTEIPKPPAKPWKSERNSYTGQTHWVGLTEEAVAEYRAAVEEYNRHIRELNSDRNQRTQAAVELLAAHGFPREYRRDTGRTRKRYETVTLLSVLAPFIPRNEEYRPYLDIEERWLKEQRESEQEARIEAAAAEYRDKAVKWLLERGKKYGEDFTADTAVSVAEEIAYEEEVARRVAEGGYHGFSGQNCDGPCEGWDGESRRCECGNRRVSWTQGDGHRFDEPYIYAEAY